MFLSCRSPSCLAAHSPTLLHPIPHTLYMIQHAHSSNQAHKSRGPSHLLPSRLTLVKGWNMAEVQQYAALVDLGQPDFIEIKGVTYCGDSGMY